MTKRVKQTTLPLVIAERFYALVSEAAEYYQRNTGFTIADQFLSAVESGLSKIEANPNLGARYVPPATFKTLKKLHYRQLNLASFSSFPYTIYYEIEVKRIVVYLLYHHSRNRDALLHS